MNISKDGKTLYFSDDEIENNTNGEKKVYVTKRINGTESHFKIDKDQNNIFNFNNETVIGVTSKKRKNVNNNSNEKRKKNAHKKINNDKNNSNNKNKKSKKKRNKSSKKIGRLISLVLLIGAIVVFALTAPIFNIVKIEVDGNNKVSSDTIISISGVKKGDNIFKFNNSIIQNIKENQYIEDVKIRRKLPGTLQISVTERNVKYQIKLINSYAYIDKNGYILEISSVNSDVPNIVGFNITENELIEKKRLETKDLETLNSILRISDSAKAIDIQDIITEINIENENDYYIYIESQNKKIYIGDVNNLTNKMLYIKKILEEEKDQSGTGFVNGDIGNGFKPYFRPE